jgi:hypothetical protein
MQSIHWAEYSPSQQCLGAQTKQLRHLWRLTPIPSTRSAETARRHERTFRETVQARNAADPESYHLMGVVAGVSHQSVPEEAIPVFTEDLSDRATVAATAPHLLLPALHAVLAFLAAHLASQSAEMN